MEFNIEKVVSSEVVLPTNLTVLIEQVNADVFNYPDRARALKSLGDYINNGDFDMALHVAKDIVERQQNLCQVVNRLPQDLQFLIRQIESEAIDYSDRPRALNSLNNYINNGDLDMARHVAKDVVDRQQNLRQVVNGLPQDLQSLISRIKNEAIEYPDRDRAQNSMNNYISNGDLDMARHVAKDIVERQHNLHQLANELPQDLQSLISQIDDEVIEYPDRARALSSMNGYISNGDLDMARHVAKDIVERQHNLYQAANGLPQDLQSFISQIDDEAIEYPDRSRAMNSLGNYICNGDFDMARHVAKDIIQRQQNLT